MTPLRTGSIQEIAGSAITGASAGALGWGQCRHSHAGAFVVEKATSTFEAPKR